MSSLSTTLTADTGTDETGRYLTFALNTEAYALDIFHVTEIIEHRTLTVVPMMPPFVRGVINLRGRAVPVLDLAIRFNRGETTIARRTSIIIVHINPDTTTDTDNSGSGGGQDIGILVDSVNKVVAFGPTDIEPAPAFGAGIRADFISGMAKQDNDFTIVLDINQVLSLNDLTGIGEAMAQAPAATSTRGTR